MSSFIEKNRKTIFYLILGCTFLCIFAYNILTPYLSDDYAYLRELRQANATFKDVFRLAWGELHDHGGRLLHYVTFRIFFYVYNKIFFDIVCSFMFVLLGLSVYFNVENKKKYDIFVLMLSYLLIWLFEVSFGEAVLWVTGSVVYLFATTYILLSLALYKYLLRTKEIKKPVLMCVLMFIIALFAGNSSENNTGAAILLVIIYTVNKYFDEKKEAGKDTKIKGFFKPQMICAYVGYLMGYMLLLLAPGAHSRATSRKEEGDYTGIVKILSNVYKISMSIRDYLWPFLVAVIILIVILAVMGRFKTFKSVRENNAILFIFAAIASSYVLMFIQLPVKRVFFGAILFFTIAFIDLLLLLKQDDKFVCFIKYSVISLLCLMFFFVYLENLVNLARVYREEKERTNLMIEAAEKGLDHVEVPLLREEFKNEYTGAYNGEMTDDPGYWINIFYEDWYGVENVIGLPRDEWDEKYKK